MSERDQGERAGIGPGHRRPSRHMRERADEMADLLALAAPGVRDRRRRRAVGIPAAVVALGALTVGGVGVAVGLDAEPTDTGIALPAEPAGPAGSPGGREGAAAPEVRVTTSAVADVPVGDDEDGDRRAASSDDAARDVSGPPARAHRPAPARRPTTPRPATTTTSAGATGSDGVSPREATSPTSPGEDPTPTRSTSTSADEEETSAADRGRSGRGADGAGDGSGSATDLRADSRGTSSVLPSRSPTGDDG